MTQVWPDEDWPESGDDYFWDWGEDAETDEE